MVVIQPFQSKPPSPRPFRFPPLSQRLLANDRVFKTGRSTELTEGFYNELKDVRILRLEDPTQPGRYRIVTTAEHAICSHRKAFAEPGDSGSFIYTRPSFVVGMLHGGLQRSDTWYFSSILDVFEDIKAVTHAREVRLPIPSE